MKLKNKINVKKSLIVFPIVFVLLISSVVGVLSFTSLLNPENGASTSDKPVDIKELINDKTALEIFNIIQNFNNYVDKEITLNAQFLKFDNNEYSIGVESKLKNDEEMIFDIVADFSEIGIPKDISDSDWVEVKGVIKSVKRQHEDHEHDAPKLVVQSIKKVDKK
ncbi:hypothetical protein CLPU_1c01360 [Gottschalkia purinilytica]|uniref:Uncharacterized protein n=1 Tax=Gottschalkia purinilytica TaxID=1503 RepID=A0A0L0WEW5_GOTPU|nr:hypothetical protein [Gottschalkia purinilytica]KNF09971.1 hypothetical protein CLPU_1c01360 [Gottschalkia purinilytica]